MKRFIIIMLFIFIFSCFIQAGSLTWTCDNCNKTFTFDPRNESYMNEWIAQHKSVCNSSSNTGYYVQQPTGPTAQELEQERIYTVHEYNDMGIEAYENGDYSTAMVYFEEAIEYDPYNPTLHENLSKAQEKASEGFSNTYISIPSYLTSIATSLGIISITPYLMIFHPSPYVRGEAMKKMTEDTMIKITEATATFILNQQLVKGKIDPIQWETEAEKEAKKQEALRHAQEIESLRLQAHQEARKKADELTESEINGETIRIEPGLAMMQLLMISEEGNW